MNYPHTYILIPYTPDRRERLKDAIAAIQNNTQGMEYSLVLYENNYIGFPNAIRNMVEDINGYVFMCASDLIMGPGWLKILWQHFDEIGRKGCIEPFNEIQGGRLCQHPLIHSDLVKKYLSREYFHFFADNEMNDRLLEDGMYTYCPKAPMEHNHVVNGKAVMDEGYKVVFDKTRNDKDRETYIKRKANGWK